MAIAIAQAGGIGVIHRNFDPDGQAAQVRQVQKYRSGMVVNPLAIGPDARAVGRALTLMKDHGISGIPVVTGAVRTCQETRRHSHQSRRALCDQSQAKSLRS